MSDNHISIFRGFLGLTRADGGPIKRPWWAKGSTITSITPTPVGSQVTIGDTGWAIEVTDLPADILDAIEESYKQARAR